MNRLRLTIIAAILVTIIATITVLANTPSQSASQPDDSHMGEYLKFNQQSGNLPANWHVYQTSLNYADYEMGTQSMGEYLKFNQQSGNLPANWHVYQASLNYADYLSDDSVSLPPIH